MLYHRLRGENEHFHLFLHLSIMLQFCVMKCNALAMRVKKKATISDFIDFLLLVVYCVSDQCMHLLTLEAVYILTL